jgi:hypothetical protein
MRIAACARRIDRDDQPPPLPCARPLCAERPRDPHPRGRLRGRFQHSHGRIEAPADLVGDGDGIDRRLDERALACCIGWPPARELVFRVQSRGDECERSAGDRNRKRWHVTQGYEPRHEQEREARPERRERRRGKQAERAHERRRRTRQGHHGRLNAIC